MLDTIRAVSTCTRHNAFALDHVQRTTPTDPTLNPPRIQAHVPHMWPFFFPRGRRAVGVGRIHGAVPTRGYARPIGPHSRCAAFLVLMTNDLVFGAPHLSCADTNLHLVADLLSHRSIHEFDASEQGIGVFLLRISLSSSTLSSSLRTPPPTLAHPSLAPVAPSSSAGPSCTTCIATIHTARRPRRPSSAAPYDASTDAVPRPHPQHQPSAHPRYATQQAPSFLDARTALTGPAGVATICSGVAYLVVLDARLRAPQLGCAILPPSAVPAASIPLCIGCFSCLPPATTISCTAPLSRSCNYHLHYHSRARSTCCAVPYRRRCTHRREARHNCLQTDSAFTFRRFPGRTYTTTGVPTSRDECFFAASTLAAMSSTPS
ncbi:hypothetical protein K438DRAFT_2000944 [Mycena galopus ATCC 62051]|nr:hypothetical protein K438DRAFT_2000944 [Mycena galopus ATCC 62051]